MRSEIFSEFALEIGLKYRNNIFKVQEQMMNNGQNLLAICWEDGAKQFIGSQEHLDRMNFIACIGVASFQCLFTYLFGFTRFAL